MKKILFGLVVVAMSVMLFSEASAFSYRTTVSVSHFGGCGQIMQGISPCQQSQLQTQTIQQPQEIQMQQMRIPDILQQISQQRIQGMQAMHRLFGQQFQRIKMEVPNQFYQPREVRRTRLFIPRCRTQWNGEQTQIPRRIIATNVPVRIIDTEPENSESPYTRLTASTTVAPRSVPAHNAPEPDGPTFIHE